MQDRTPPDVAGVQPKCGADNERLDGASGVKILGSGTGVFSRRRMTRDRNSHATPGRKNSLSNFFLVGQPPSAVRTDDSPGRLSHIRSYASADLVKLFLRGA